MGALRFSSARAGRPSDADRRRGAGRGETEEQQVDGGETVEMPFEPGEEHETHTFQSFRRTQGPAGRFLDLNAAKITPI